LSEGGGRRPERFWVAEVEDGEADLLVLLGDAGSGWRARPRRDPWPRPEVEGLPGVAVDVEAEEPAVLPGSPRKMELMA